MTQALLIVAIAFITGATLAIASFELHVPLQRAIHSRTEIQP